jgi:hypothetical protein
MIDYIEILKAFNDLYPVPTIGHQHNITINRKTNLPLINLFINGRWWPFTIEIKDIDKSAQSIIIEINEILKREIGV